VCADRRAHLEGGSDATPLHPHLSQPSSRRVSGQAKAGAGLSIPHPAPRAKRRPLDAPADGGSRIASRHSAKGSRAPCDHGLGSRPPKEPPAADGAFMPACRRGAFRAPRDYDRDWPGRRHGLGGAMAERGSETRQRCERYTVRFTPLEHALICAKKLMRQASRSLPFSEAPPSPFPSRA